MRRLFPALSALVITGCLQYEDSTDPDTSTAADTTADTTVEDRGGADGSADAAADVEETWGQDLPPYEPAACGTAAALTESYTPPACDYSVPIQVGILDVRWSCGTSSDPPEGLHITFPTENAGRDVAMTWSTPSTTRESVIRIGESADTLDRVYFGTTLSYSGLVDRVIHEVHVCGLLPGRTYYYQAGGEGAWSEVHSFSTAPDPSEADWEIVFGVTGDSRSDDFEMWGQAVQAMRDKGAEFIVFSGDAVESGPVQAQWDRFFELGQPGLAEMPYLPCNGNHDLIISTYLGQLALPRDEAAFAVRYGDLHFVSLTDFYIQNPAAIGGEFATFLDDSLTANADASWKFLINHRPFYSASTRHGSATDLQSDWGPILDEHEVDLVFNGHDHNYERSKPIRGGAVDARGTIYTVIAGVGAPLYDNGQQWWTEYSEKVPSYAIIRVTPTTLDFTAYRLDGTVIDTLSKTR